MEKLTDEVLLIVFSFLPTKDLLQVQQVNRRFRIVCADSTLFRQIYLDKNLMLSANCFHNLCLSHKDRIKVISLMDCFWLTSNHLVNGLQNCSHIEELLLNGTRLSIKGLCKIAANKNNLKRLGWSVPNPFPSDIQKEGHQYGILQKILTNLTGILLRFDSISSFESFLPLFDTNNICVNEFGIEYLSERTASYFASGNIYKMYVKSKDRFQICLKDALDANRFLHFNLLITDFVMQTLSKAAHKNNIITLLAPGNTNSLCWKYINSVLSIQNYKKIHISCATLNKEQITWLSKLNDLTHLNLTNVVSFKMNLMRAIATNCPNLKSLNLSHTSDWIDKDLYGLESIAAHCPLLSQLNLSSLHIHGQIELNKFCSIIGEMKLLKHLSLPSCGLVNNISVQESNSPVTSRSSSFKPAVASNLTFSFDSSSSSNDSTDFSNYVTRKVRLSQEQDSLTEQNGSGLDIICSQCQLIEEFEIINTGFNSAFNRTTNGDQKNFCPLSSHLRDKVFHKIGQLKNLRKLTLAGLSGISSFSTLQSIATSCEMLEDLSIAYCGLSGHSGNLSSLQGAISRLANLKRFRFDQPHFQIKESFLEALCECRQLQVLCLINKNGKAPKSIDHYVKLFENCRCLVGFFMFNGFIAPEAKAIQTKLSKMFRKRSSLCVSVLPYFNALTEEGLKNVPYIYLRDVIRFESHVAVCNFDGT